MTRIAVFFVLLALLLSGCVDCEEVKDDARALKLEYSRCEAGDSCVIADMYELAGANTCLAAFQCATAFNADKDLDRFSSRARALADDFEECPECVTASCDSSDGMWAECDVEEGLCVLLGGYY